MAGELITHLLHPESIGGAKDMAVSLSHNTKAAVGGAGTVLFGAAAVAWRISQNGKTSGHEGTVKDGRVRRVEAGWLGLRERNNKFYKSIPMYDGFNPGGEPLYYHHVFYDLMEPGFRISPMPLRKYKLINTKSDPIGLRRTTIMGQDKLLYDVDGIATWGHIRGFDENRRRIKYEYTTGKEVCVEELVLNGIMAGKSEQGVAEQISGEVITRLVEILNGEYEFGSTDFKPEPVFEAVERDCHDFALDRGAELRALSATISPNVLSHTLAGADPRDLSWKTLSIVMPGAVPDLTVLQGGVS